MVSYGYERKVDLPFDQALAATREALRMEGFGVITEIDMKKNLKEKLGVDFRSYVILGACNPPMAFRAVSTELEVGLLMPCNVCVWDNGDGTSTVAAVDVKALFQLVQRPGLAPVAKQVDAGLRRAVDRV